VARESIMARKAVAALTWVWLDSSVDLGVALEIVLADEAFLAGWALILPVIEMGLDVALDILFPSKAFPAVLVATDPLAINRIWTFDVDGNFVERHSRVGFGLFNVDAGDAGSARN